MLANNIDLAHGPWPPYFRLGENVFEHGTISSKINKVLCFWTVKFKQNWFVTEKMAQWEGRDPTVCWPYSAGPSAAETMERPRDRRESRASGNFN